MADFLGMMKQAAQLQSKMKAMQDELEHVEVEGVSGGGLVTVRMTAKMEVKGIKIDPSLMKAEDIEILEDLLVTAHGDARRKAGDGDAGKDAVADRWAWSATRVWSRLIWLRRLPVLRSNGLSNCLQGCPVLVRARRSARRCI